MVEVVTLMMLKASELSSSDEPKIASSPSSTSSFCSLKTESAASCSSMVLRLDSGGPRSRSSQLELRERSSWSRLRVWRA